METASPWQKSSCNKTLRVVHDAKLWRQATKLRSSSVAPYQNAQEKSMLMPTQTKLGVALLFFSVAANAAIILTGIPLSLFRVWLRSAQIVNFVFPIAPLFLRLFLLAMIWNRKSWARIAFALLTLVGVVSVPFLPSATRGYWLLVLSLLCEMAGLALLFLQPAANWFKESAPTSD
jgi:hypothetical protein